MNTSASSVLLSVLVWYFLLGVYNIIFFSLTQKIKDLDWKKFILDTLGILVVYIIVNILSIQIAGESTIALFAIINAVLVLGAGYLYARFAMKLDNKKSLMYSGSFLVAFNLYWYVLVGIL